VAILAAPLFIILYLTLFQDQSIDLSTLLSDKRSLFFLILFYPIVEELAFRGVIQEFIASKTRQVHTFFHVSLANVLTSILFVLMHFVHHQPLWALMVFVPSLIFGYFKEQYQSIYPGIFLHIFYNTCSLFIII